MKIRCPKCKEQYNAKPYELRDDELCPQCASYPKTEEEVPIKGKKTEDELLVLSLDEKYEVNSNANISIDKSKLDEIKRLWEKEVDNYLIKAATVDFNEYPLEVQQIIKDEVNRRGLEGAKFCKPSVVVETGDNIAGNIKSFFAPEILLIN